MIGLINYGMGNLGSVRRTFEILNIENRIINNPSEITICKKLVLPGVGNFSNAMKILNNNGWSEKIIKHSLEEKKPLLGICLGMQCAVIEYARNVCKLKSANSTEFDDKTTHPVIDIMHDQKDVTHKGATMRLGSYSCDIKEESVTLVLKKGEIEILKSKLLHK